MSTSPGFSVRLHRTFDQSLQRLSKKYYKKNPAARDELADLLEVYYQLFEEGRWPRNSIRPQPWPRGQARVGWEFEKLYFRLPQLKGEAGEGRIMFLHERSSRVVEWFWIYNHAQFPKRPPDDELRRAMRTILG